MKRIMILCLLATLLPASYGRESKSLTIVLDKYIPSGTNISGGKIATTPPKTAFCYDKFSKKNYLSFNGRDESLIIKPLSIKTKETLNNSFTLEFDFFTDKLPVDKLFYDKRPRSIEIFAAIDAAGKNILQLTGNRYNRFTAIFKNKEGNYSQAISTWNNKDNYEITSILRGKWYHTALVFDKEKKLFSLFLDGELAGTTKTTSSLANVSKLVFGGNTTKASYEMLAGGIRNITLSPGTLYNSDSSKVSSKQAKQRLQCSARQTIAKLLLPENPDWSKNHPRMLLTPTRIEALKASLQHGKGPELLARLINECDAAITPGSSMYYDKIIGGHNTKSVMKPAVLSLATLLTGNAKYAKHAAKVIVRFTKELGYYDMSHQLVMSAGYAKPIMAISLAYDWSYQYLTPIQRRQIRLFLLEIAKGTYDFYSGGEYSTAKRDALGGWVANWTGLSISTLGNTSLAILGETNGDTLTWLDYAKFRAVQYGLFAIGTNGCFHEMPHYLAFGAGPIIVFMEALATAGGDDLLLATNFSKFPDFLAYVLYPFNNKTMSLKYSSELSGLHRTDSYIMALLRKKLRTNAVEWDWQKIYGNAAWSTTWSLFALIWFEAEKTKQTSPSLPLGKWFTSEGVAAFRSGWDKDAVAGIFMAYPAKIVAHDQCDRGQFNLYGYQGRWIIDSGGRHLPEHAHRNAHNLVTIDNREPRFKTIVHTNHHHDAFMTNFCHMDTLITAAEADLTNSYRYIYNWQHNPVGSSGKANTKDSFKRAERKLLFMQKNQTPPYLLVLDKVQQDDKPHEYTLNLHTAPENEVIIKNSSAIFKQFPSLTQGYISYVVRPLNSDGSNRYYYSGSPKAGYAEYNVNIPNGGKYNLYGFGRPGEKNPGGMDSFFVCFDNRRINWGTNSTPAYRWSKINKTPFDLKAGSHPLTLLLREPEARVAKFALCPAGNIPVFANPKQKGLILINAAKPTKLVNDFTIGTEQISTNTPEAFMSLKQLYPDTGFSKKAFKGNPLNHYCLTTTSKSTQAFFLNFFYPYKAGMVVPEVSKVTQGISIIKWSNCQDIICLNTGKGIHYKQYQSDADLTVIREQGDDIIAFTLVNGSYLKNSKTEFITLHGGSGIASWNNNSLVISGKDVYNFTFNFPETRAFFSNLLSSSTLKNVKAQGNMVDVQKTTKGWQATSPFVSRNVLTW